MSWIWIQVTGYIRNRNDNQNGQWGPFFCSSEKGNFQNKVKGGIKGRVFLRSKRTKYPCGRLLWFSIKYL